MLSIVQVKNGVFDLAFKQNPTDATAAASVAYIALFTDAENNNVDAYDRRGWFDDIAVGSKLWWLRQQALSDDIRLQVIAEVKLVLEAHGFEDVVVTEKLVAGNVSSVAIEVTATHNSVTSIFDINL